MSFLALFQIVALSVGVFAIIAYRLIRKKITGLSLPPGPKPLPIVGNIRDLPPSGQAEYLHWLTFKDKYGPLSSVTVLGQTVVLIHDERMVSDLLEKNSLKTSGRPAQIFVELCALTEFITLKAYTESFRQHRKLLHQQLGTKAIASRFNDVQDVESRRLLLRVLKDPEDLLKKFKLEAAAIIMKIIYGYSVETQGTDPLLAMINRMMQHFSQASPPLSWMVDILPILRHLPEGFPGAGFRKTAREWAQNVRGVANIPYSFVKKQVNYGTHLPSYVSSVIERSDTLSAEDEHVIKYTAGAMYGGGSDTTVSTLNSFVLAMVLFPEVQRKAQEEIDQVTGGTERLPGFEDRERLPYVNALIKEALRWIPVISMGIPHSADEEIVYGGYRIPKGSYLLPATWWLLHDPQTYSNPSVFDPTRFLEPRNEPDPEAHAFGYGRRVCPGRYLAVDSLFITIVRMLATLKIGKAVDEDGNEMEARYEILPGTLSFPRPFPYVVKTRSLAHADLIRSAEAECPQEVGDAVHIADELRKSW